LKKHLLTLLKVGISVAIVAWLVARAENDDAFSDLKAQYVDPGFAWGLLAAASLCCGVAVVITLIRWYYLVRALDMPFSLREALRLGFLGYLFNLAPMGIVGGDLLKAVMLARQQPGRRAQAFATVAVDRVIGLYMLFVVASAAVLLTGFCSHQVEDIRYIARATLLVTALSSAGVVALFIPGFTHGRLTSWLSGLRYVGKSVGHLIDAVRMYRRQGWVLLTSALMSIAVHSLFTVAIYLITVGIYAGNVANLSLRGEFIVSPLSAATQVIPLPAGPMEGAAEYLYKYVFDLDHSQGLVVALGYRIITVLIAAVGVCYYLSARREVAAVMHEAELAEDVGGGPTAQAVASDAAGKRGHPSCP
jgi:glycosyltransferase 2 family protein